MNSIIIWHWSALVYYFGYYTMGIFYWICQWTYSNIARVDILSMELCHGKACFPLDGFRSNMMDTTALILIKAIEHIEVISSGLVNNDIRPILHGSIMKHVVASSALVSRFCNHLHTVGIVAADMATDYVHEFALKRLFSFHFRPDLPSWTGGGRFTNDTFSKDSQEDLGHAWHLIVFTILEASLSTSTPVALWCFTNGCYTVFLWHHFAWCYIPMPCWFHIPHFLATSWHKRAAFLHTLPVFCEDIIQWRVCGTSGPRAQPFSAKPSCRVLG